jgi:hypothetical protein
VAVVRARLERVLARGARALRISSGVTVETFILLLEERQVADGEHVDLVVRYFDCNVRTHVFTGVRALDGPHLALDDEDGLRASCQQGREPQCAALAARDRGGGSHRQGIAADAGRWGGRCQHSQALLAGLV